MLKPDDQRKLIQKTANALKPSTGFFFTAPYQICQWEDLLTGRRSQFLGREGYIHIAKDARLRLIDMHEDAGENHYFEMKKL